MTPAVIIIGNFDGVHIGHAALVQRARATSTHARIIACTFDPHPLTILRPESAPPLLSTFDQRCRWLAHLGVDEVIRLEPTPEFLAKSPETFIEDLLALHRITAIVEGPDFRFGKGRSGDISTLRDLGRAHSFEVHIVDPITAVLTDQSIVTASSSLIRWLISHGRVDDAAIILGRAYEITGTVIRGEARGRTLGFPTANIATRMLLPADGVYAGSATLADGQRLAAAISLGTKPTFGRGDRTLEALLLAPAPEARASWTPARVELEYDWPIVLRISTWLRDQLRFDSIDRLTEQMSRDCDRVMALARTFPPALEPIA